MQAEVSGSENEAMGKSRAGLAGAAARVLGTQRCGGGQVLLCLRDSQVSGDGTRERSSLAMLIE